MRSQQRRVVLLFLDAAAQEKRRTVNLTSNVCFVKKGNLPGVCVCGDHKRTRRSKKVGKVEVLPLVIPRMGAVATTFEAAM